MEVNELTKLTKLRLFGYGKKRLLDSYRKARLDAGISLHHAAKILGVDACDLLDFENGEINMSEIKKEKK